MEDPAAARRLVGGAPLAAGVSLRRDGRRSAPDAMRNVLEQSAGHGLRERRDDDLLIRPGGEAVADSLHRVLLADITVDRRTQLR